jgi:proline iminopeptidase
MLEVGEGNAIYWEVCGNPEGKAAVALHGGPGSGSNPEWRRWFDPEAYRVVFFDQRGSGRSTPHASDPSVDLSSNTTRHLIADMERLRQYLGIERWLVCGGSWGSTLGLAYSEQHPECVSELVLFSVALTRRADVEWMTRTVGRLFPEAWARFRDGVPAAARDGSLADAYARLLEDPDERVREAAARSWCAWESAHVAVRGSHALDPRKRIRASEGPSLDS